MRTPDGHPVPDEAVPGESVPSDAELIERCQQRDAHAPVAFDELYRRHRDWAVRTARRFTGDDDAALDAAHDVFAALLKRLGRPPKLRLRAHLTTYLYQALRHASARARRKRSAQHRLATQAGQWRSPAGVREHPELREAVGRLPEAQREVLLLHAVDGLTLEEVAAALTIPLGTAKSRLHKALSRLRADERLTRLFED